MASLLSDLGKNITVHGWGREAIAMKCVQGLCGSLRLAFMKAILQKHFRLIYIFFSASVLCLNSVEQFSNYKT